MATVLRRCLGPVVLAGLLLGGCQPVREDRSIHFSPDGQRVAFQNGREGVFVADGDGEPQKIFQPDASVLATSPPLWSPVDGRLIFTTAEVDPQGSGLQIRASGDPDPAGNIHFQREVVYTCWLREEGADPVPLFRARSEHVGTVAAGLAVRWHPGGESLLYLERTGPGQHGLFEYRLRDRARRRVFPLDSYALVFEYSPDKVYLACVRSAGADNQSVEDGIWIGKAGCADWWHVPGSERLPESKLPSILEQLRAALPVWSPDGDRFAFVSRKPFLAGGRCGEHFLSIGTRSGRTVERFGEGPCSFADLRWSPDGTRLGSIWGGEGGLLCETVPGRGWPRLLDTEPVRHFAGWNAAGTHLAYVVSGESPHRDGAAWAFLFGEVPQARDAVRISTGWPGDPGWTAFSGMRVTFPRWSPGESKLSLWATFTPTYRSSLGLALEAGLRSGDPAVVLDPATGELSWKAVNAGEKVQVGHYYLQKRDYAEAWRWYEQADREAPAGAGTFAEWLEGLASHRESAFFEFLCLEKLGRADEAREKLARFEQAFRRRPDTGPLRRVLDPELPYAALLRDLYAAEVFFSLDAIEDGERFFWEAPTGTDQDRLSRALVLSQLLLAQKKREEYAELAASEIVPLVLRLGQTAQGSTGLDSHPKGLLLTLAGLALLPLCAPEFLAELPEGQVWELSSRWRELSDRARCDDVVRVGIDLLREAACRRLGWAEREALVPRIQENPARSEMPGGEQSSRIIAAARDRAAVLAFLQRTVAGMR
jgi:hypothetical protein